MNINILFKLAQFLSLIVCRAAIINLIFPKLWGGKYHYGKDVKFQEKILQVFRDTTKAPNPLSPKIMFKKKEKKDRRPDGKVTTMYHRDFTTTHMKG